MFIQTLATDPHRFMFVLVTVVVSITLHELAHGWAALWQGDDTPRVTGHMTPNPIVHMTWFSVVLFLISGLAFGLMPVNPSRFRSKYGEAYVAAAGPVMNLLLGLLALTGLALWIRHGGFWDDQEMGTTASNYQKFLWHFGATNFALFLLNLLPIPPLDGSAILANLNAPYARWTQSMRDPQVFVFVFMGVIILMNAIDFGFVKAAEKVSLSFVNAVSGEQFYFKKP